MCSLNDNKIVIIGGHDGKKKKQEYLQDVWSLNNRTLTMRKELSNASYNPNVGAYWQKTESFVGLGNRSAQIKPNTLVAIATDIDGLNAQLITYTIGQPRVNTLQKINDTSKEFRGM